MRRVCWKKGMRLTDDIFRASDDSVIDFVEKALLLSSAGRFGLLPIIPFEVSLNISKENISVESLQCMAITKGGRLIDIHYDTKFTNLFDTQVPLTLKSGEKEYMLTIDCTDKWTNTNDGFEVPVYSFSLFASNSPIPENSFPIAHIVDEYGWRVDDINFVPPCLFITSHHKYVEIQHSFLETLKTLDAKTKALTQSNAKKAISIFWPIVQQLMITVDKEFDTMTPMSLLANVQKCVSAFVCACELDDYLELADAERFYDFIYSPYNYKDAYIRIREGLDLCYTISEKIDKLSQTPTTPAGIEAPTIEASQLFKKCTNSMTKVQVTNNVQGATVLYSIGNEEPSQNLKKGQIIPIESGFNSSRKKEPDKVIVVKVKAILGNESSATNAYEITLHKDIERWTGLEI